jgi:hypothetical protein
MDEKLLEDITIYHKIQNGWDRYPVKASVRDTSIRNRTNTGKSDNDTVLIRIFDVDGYGSSYTIAKDDVIVRGNVDNQIVSAPLTELRAVYGKENVYLVRSIDKYIFDDVITKELQHIKIGAI